MTNKWNKKRVIFTKVELCYVYTQMDSSVGKVQNWNPGFNFQGQNELLMGQFP